MSCDCRSCAWFIPVFSSIEEEVASVLAGWKAGYIGKCHSTGHRLFGAICCREYAGPSRRSESERASETEAGKKFRRKILRSKIGT